MASTKRGWLVTIGSDGLALVHSMEDRPTRPAVAQPSDPTSQWRFPALLLLVLVGIVLSRRETSMPRTQPVEKQAPLSSAMDTVRLEVDFGDGQRLSFDPIAWQPGMTVLHVLEAASQSSEGLRFSVMGEGAGGFLTELAGIPNEGATGRNWLYEVAGVPGKSSLCIETVDPGEVVLWRFTNETDSD